MTTTELKQLFSDMDRLHVVVVGDVMLDNYWWGQVDRISPEAPVPVVAIQKKETRIGGAANVALNCKALGAKVTLASVLGADESGKMLIDLCAEAGIDTQLLMQSLNRITTNKTRVLSRNQQMMRLDEEQADELLTADEHPFIDKVLRMLQREKPQVLIFEDYNKGVLKENVIDRITRHCKELGMITLVDPKKHNFLAYKDVTIFKPNLKEVREGLAIPLKNVNLPQLMEAHAALQDQLGHKATFITLSELGVFVAAEDQGYLEPAHIRNIADVSGAGDTVVATAALVYALTQDLRTMAAIANIAGGLVCEEVGVKPIDKTKLEEECMQLVASAS
ncbi:bifunctional ADP-heptose synthase [Rurimicrobium arvi]|uniref:D-glycero-beta-D-manno-heptose-7-phosphate kinase n=1 Tax=Rurimicrobium arvi TaxID=2049916 RepID=A0ABP8MUA1_9BACT